VDCDNADPMLGGAELLDDGFDNDCDGFAVVDLRNWPALSDDAPCVSAALGREDLLFVDGASFFPADGPPVPADRVASVPDQDGDGIEERLWALDGRVHYAPSAGGEPLEVDTEVPVDASLAWGGLQAGCPTFLSAEPHPTQSSWSQITLTDLCSGAVVATWSFGDPDQRPDRITALAITPNLWPDLVQVRLDADLARVGVVFRQSASASAGHDAFDVELTRAGAASDGAFASHVAAGDVDGDNFAELAIATADGAWLVRGGTLSSASGTVRLEDVGLRVELADVGAAPGSTVLDVGFSDLDGDGRSEWLLATDAGDGVGYRVFVWAWDDEAEALRHSALMVAPEGRCSESALSERVFVAGGVPWLLPQNR
jgi:hypothetical protein